MTVSPPRRRSRIVFWIAALAILSAIAATALLANDKRNLRAIAERYHLGWLKLGLTEAERPAPRIKRETRQIPVRPFRGKPVSPHFFSQLQADPSAFLRRWKIAGETVCGRIAQAGFAVSPWRKGDLDNTTYECSYQTPVSQTATAEQPSLFIIVRGMSDGEIANVRIKAILPDTQAGNELRQKFQALVALLVRESQWNDLDEAVSAIDRLQNVTQSTYGARLVFSHEFADPRRFNFILDLDKPGKDEIATAAFFDTSKRLPLTDTLIVH